MQNPFTDHPRLAGNDASHLPPLQPPSPTRRYWREMPAARSNSRLEPTRFGILLTLAACATATPEAPETDPRELDFGAITPAQLVALDLPAGCRPGDRLREPTSNDPAVQQRAVYGQRWTFEPQPERVVFRVEAYGRDHRTSLLNVAIADSHQQPLDEFARAAGVQVGEVVGFVALPYARDRATMSADHLHDLERAGVILATDRERTFLVERSGRIDSVLWVQDETLLPQLRAVLFASAFTPVRDHLQRQDAAAATAALEALGTHRWQRVPEPVRAAEAELRQAVQTLAMAKDRAPREAYQQALAAAQSAIAAAHPFAAIGLYQARRQQLQGLAAAIVDDRPDPVPELFLALRTAAKRHVDGREAETPSDLAYRYLGNQLAEWDDAVTKLLNAAQGLERATSYAEAYLAVLTFDRVLQETGHLTAGYGDLFRAALAAVADREAAAVAAARRPTPARYFRDLAMRLQAATGHFDSSRFESGAQVTNFVQRLDAYDAVVGDDQKIAWVIAQAPDGLEFRGSEFGKGRNWQEFHQNYFLADLVQPRHDQELQRAAALRQQGLPASAATHTVAAAAIVGVTDWGPNDCRQALAPTNSRQVSIDQALQTLLPFLRVVLPPIGPTTAEANRLTELLREGPCLEWPLLHRLAFRMSPGDLQTFAGVDQFAALVQRGDTYVLEDRDTPQELAEDLVALQRLSGISAATLAEGRALAGEAAAIDAEQQQIAAEKAVVEPLADALAAQEKQIETERAGASASAAAQAEFNRRVDAHNVQLRELRPRQEALQAKIAALNARIATYNPRVAVNNERRMRERAAGGAKVDALLRTALDQWLSERLGVYEAQLRTAGHDDATVAQEMRCARWWLGRETTSVLPSFVTYACHGHRQLRREAIARTIHQQPTNESLAAAVVEHWVLSQDYQARDAGNVFFREWANTFRTQRDIGFLQRAVAARTDLPEHQRAAMLAMLTSTTSR